MEKQDKEEVLRLILDHPDLQQYFHPEVKGRVPVRIKTTEELGNNLSIEKFGKSVEISPSFDSGNDTPLVEIVEFQKSNDQVSFEIAYDIEGIVVKGNLEKGGGKWSVKEFLVSEH